MAEPRPTPYQRLRTYHRIGNGVAVHGLRPNAHYTHRKTMISYNIIIGRTLIAKGMLVNDTKKCGRVTPPMIEKILEYRFLAELTSELYWRDTPFDVMRGDVDHHGYDLAIEANGILRHIQLKGIKAKGQAGDWEFNVNLWQRGSGCIVILEHEEHCRKISGIRFLGGPPGRPLPQYLPLLTKKNLETYLERNLNTCLEGKQPSKKVKLTKGCIPQLTKEEEVKELVLKLFGELPPRRSS